MAASSPITEMLLLVASVVLASGLSAYSLYLGGVVESSLSQTVDDAARTMSLRVEIVYATIEQTPSLHYVVYVKNIGSLPVSSFEKIDVYCGPYGRAGLFVYRNGSTEDGYFSLVIAGDDGNGVWDPGETAVIRAYSSNISGEVFEARVKPFRGLGDEYVFPSPP